MPDDDNGRLAWLITFNTKIAGYATTFGISAAEVTAIGSYLALLQYILDLADSVRTFSQTLTRYKDTLMIAPLGTTLGDVPEITIAAPPAVTPAGIFTIISGIVQRIKGNSAYTESIGENLGIIGADIIIDYAALKPVLKITMVVNNPKIKYKKNRTDGLNLYADHDDGQGMKLMRFISKATFVDATALQAAQNSAVFKYIGIYVVDDTEVGIPGDEVTVTVKKKV